MKQILNNDMTYLITAARQWHARLTQAAGLQNVEVLWSDNVYEAMAIAVTARQRQQRLTALLVIDTMSNDEMAIFTRLRELGNVKSVALAVQDNPEKIDQARKLGADHAQTITHTDSGMNMIDLKRLFAKTDPTERAEQNPEPVDPARRTAMNNKPLPPERPAKPENQTKTSSLTPPDRPTPGRQPASRPMPAQKPEHYKAETTPEAQKQPRTDKKYQKKTISPPVLTPEELDALLG